MVNMTIESLIMGAPPLRSVVTLCVNRKGIHDFSNEDVKDDTVLPICMGIAETSAIAAALEEKRPERPLSHETAIRIATALGGSISRVIIDKVKDDVFYATLYLRCSNGMFTRVDARPSDAIALAITADAPLFVEDDVLKVAGAPRSLMTPYGEKTVELEEFHKFINDVKPEDFLSDADGGSIGGDPKGYDPKNNEPKDN